MPNINLMLNNKHEFRILQCWQYNLQCEEALYRNSQQYSRMMTTAAF